VKYDGMVSLIHQVFRSHWQVSFDFPSIAAYTHNWKTLVNLLYSGQKGSTQEYTLSYLFLAYTKNEPLSSWLIFSKVMPIF
jgi:hypothetical protein